MTLPTSPGPAPEDAAPSLTALLRSGKELLVVRQDECVFTNKSLVLSTSLGSCVAAAFRHRPTRYCALFHAFWPEIPEGENVSRPCRFAASAVAGISARYRAAGIQPEEVEVDVAGGAFSGSSPGGMLDIGKRNVEAVLRGLRAEGFQVCSVHVLGEASRTIFLDTDSGRTWIRAMQPGWRRLAFDQAQALSTGNGCRLELLE